MVNFNPKDKDLPVDNLTKKLQNKAYFLFVINPITRSKTRGPRGPWVAHLRKRSKVTVEPIIENHRGIN